MTGKTTLILGGGVGGIVTANALRKRLGEAGVEIGRGILQAK